MVVMVLVVLIIAIGIPEGAGVLPVPYSISVVDHVEFVNEDGRISRKWSDSNVEYERDNLPRDRQELLIHLTLPEIYDSRGGCSASSRL